MKKKRIFLSLVALFVFIAIWSQVVVGNATYYANRFHGQRTSNGQRYHKDSLTCAHMTYPFGTYLKVRNRDNGKTVVVRVNDRGPYSNHAMIDLSRAAAARIGLISSGYAQVEITKVDGPVYEEENPLEFPDFKGDNPNDNRYYSSQDWDNSVKDNKLEAKATPWTGYAPAKKEEPKRWRILSDRMTAEGNMPANVPAATRFQPGVR